MGIFWILVPMVVIVLGAIKWLFWLFLIALLFTADDKHLKLSRAWIFVVIGVYVLAIVIYESAYNAVGFAYAVGGLFLYFIFHVTSGAFNKSEKIRKLKLKNKLNKDDRM